MNCDARSQRFTSKVFLSQVVRKIAIAAACAALIFCARPALAQRGGGGGGHAGGGSAAGHSGGFAGGRANHGDSFSGGGGRSYGGMRGPSYSSAHDGIEIFSGAGSRGGYTPGEFSRGDSESFHGGEFYGGESRGDSVRDGIVSYSGAPRHTTIGFPQSGGSWQVPASAHGSGAPLAFAGQGRTVWQESSRENETRDSENRDLSSRSFGKSQRPAGGNREDRNVRARDHFAGGYSDRNRDRRRVRGPYYPYGGYGYGAYAIYPWLYFGESGFGNWSNCDQWTADWDWQEQGCEGNEPQIVAYGADGVYPAPQTITDTRLQEYIRQHPWVGNASIAEGPDERLSNSESDAIAQGSSARSNSTAETLLYLTDGTNFDVNSYWLSGGDLHYITSYGGENAVSISQVDLQRTVNVNAARGVPFTLRPAPRGGSGAGRR